jgi:hypothetical protein
MPDEIHVILPEWDPFQGHTCESCDERRSQYTEEDAAINAETFAQQAVLRAEAAVEAFEPLRGAMLSEATQQRDYWSEERVAERIQVKINKYIRRAHEDRADELKRNLQHHVEQEAIRVYNLPEAVAAREAASREIVREQHAVADRYNTPDILRQHRAVITGRGLDHELRTVSARLAGVSGERASALLRSVIGEERWAYYQATREFYFMSPRGHKYRIGKGYSQQVYAYHEPDSIRFGIECCYPSPTDPLTQDSMPFEDLMAGQFLSIMADEPTFLRTSYVSGDPAPWRNATREAREAIPVLVPKLNYDIAPDGSVRKLVRA